jgi:CheY-like chemotaxis protein
MAKVMVVSPDPVIASLLGALLEVEQHRVVFPKAAEAAHAALDREEPELILLDCDHPEFRTETLIGRATTRGTGVVLFSPGRVGDEVRERAEQSGLSWFSLPIDRLSLSRVLAAALAGPQRPQVADNS